MASTEHLQSKLGKDKIAQFVLEELKTVMAKYQSGSTLSYEESELLWTAKKQAIDFRKSEGSVSNQAHKSYR